MLNIHYRKKIFYKLKRIQRTNCKYMNNLAHSSSFTQYTVIKCLYDLKLYLLSLLSAFRCKQNYKLNPFDMVLKDKFDFVSGFNLAVIKYLHCI